MRQCEKEEVFFLISLTDFIFVFSSAWISNGSAAYYRKYADINEASLIHKNTKSTTEYT